MRSTRCPRTCVHAGRIWRSWSKTNRHPGQRLLGLYQGVPLTRRGSYYGGVLPDKITIYRGPLPRLYGHDAELLGREVRRVVLHEIAHHVGISDERLVEIDRY
jgi:predicted Zn-dependent protease with MMP-like domain